MSILETRNLTKSYSDFCLRNINLEIKRGYIHALIGPNGAGKTTLIKAMLDLIIPDSGEVRILDQPLKNNEIKLKQKIGFVLEEESLFEDLTLEGFEKIMAPFYTEWDSRDFFILADRTGLPRKKKLKNMSKGMRMNVQLITALAHNPELVILDEPLNGLDPVARQETLDLLQERLESRNLTIFISSHITSDLDKIADYITFLNGGEHIFTRSRLELLEETRLIVGPTAFLKKSIDLNMSFIQTHGDRFKAIAVRQDLKSFTPDDLKEHRLTVERPTIEDIMILRIKGERK